LTDDHIHNYELKFTEMTRLIWKICCIAGRYLWICDCTDWPPPIYWGPRMPEGIPGVRGQGPLAQAPAPAPVPIDQDSSRDLESATSSSVRSNFPETWIWTEAMTGYTLFGIVSTTFVGYCSRAVCTNLFIWWISVDVLVHLDAIMQYVF